MIGFTASLEGLSRSEAQFNQAAWQVARSSEATAPGGQDTVDLSAAAVAMLQAKNNFDANTKAIKVGDEMQQYLLDAIG
jgi:flagellar hook protein FlgE